VFLQDGLPHSSIGNEKRSCSCALAVSKFRSRDGRGRPSLYSLLILVALGTLIPWLESCEIYKGMSL
jgi:hypothetical protein